MSNEKLSKDQLGKKLSHVITCKWCGRPRSEHDSAAPLGATCPDGSGLAFAAGEAFTSKQRLDERTGAPELWVYRDGYHFAQVTFTKPDPKLYPTAVRYVLADETTCKHKAEPDPHSTDAMRCSKCGEIL